MPCFNPENVIFITNKWDTIANDEEDSSDEDKETKTWNTLKDNIKRRWPSLKEEFIFRMNLREVIINQVKLFVVYVFDILGWMLRNIFNWLNTSFCCEGLSGKKELFNRTVRRIQKCFRDYGHKS